jgi:hypothetical protein
MRHSAVCLIIAAAESVSHDPVEHVSEIIQSIPDVATELRLSPQKAKRIDSIELVRQQRDERKQELLFNSRPFLLCGLPIRRPSPGTLVHERRNGTFFLQVCAHPHFGLPYGQDRLVPIWVATQAVRSRKGSARARTLRSSGEHVPD